MEFCRGTEGTRTSFHIPMRPWTTSPQLCRNPFARSSPAPCIRSSRISSSSPRPRHQSTPIYNIRVDKFREYTRKVRHYYGLPYKGTTARAGNAVVRALPGDSKGKRTNRNSSNENERMGINTTHEISNSMLLTFARPKSVRQMCPFAPNRRFSGLRSLPANQHVSKTSRSNR